MQFPRVKDGHRPVRVGDSLIRIGGPVFGAAAEFHDPTGLFWKALHLMDGRRSAEQVVYDLIRWSPTAARAEAASAVEQLLATPYVEDAHLLEEAPAGARRHGRSRTLYQWMDLEPRSDPWRVQRILSETSVSIVGVGGAGSHAAVNLARMGVASLDLFDSDVVEESNLSRQCFAMGDLGVSKSFAAANYIKSFSPEVRVATHQYRVHSVIDFEKPFRISDIVVVTADSPGEVKAWANHVALRMNKPWVHGGYQGPEVMVGIHDPRATDGGCYECLRRHQRLLRGDMPVTQWREGVEAPRGNAANAVTTAMAGAMIAHSVGVVTAGVPAWRVNAEYWYNLLTGTADRLEVEDGAVCDHVR